MQDLAQLSMNQFVFLWHSPMRAQNSQSESDQTFSASHGTEKRMEIEMKTNKILFDDQWPKKMGTEGLGWDDGVMFIHYLSIKL